MFEVNTEAGPDGVSVVRAIGEVDMTVSPRFEQTLLDAVHHDSSRRIVVDFASLRFIDSSGIHALVKGYQAARDTGGSLVVRNAGGVVARVLYITGVAEVLGLPVDQADEYPKGA